MQKNLLFVNLFLLYFLLSLMFLTLELQIIKKSCFLFFSKHLFHLFETFKRLFSLHKSLAQNRSLLLELNWIILKHFLLSFSEINCWLIKPLLGCWRHIPIHFLLFFDVFENFCRCSLFKTFLQSKVLLWVVFTGLNICLMDFGTILVFLRSSVLDIFF